MAKKHIEERGHAVNTFPNFIDQVIEKGMRELEESLQDVTTQQDFIADMLNYYLVYMEKYVGDKEVDLDAEKQEIIDTINRKGIPQNLNSIVINSALGFVESIGEKSIQIVSAYQERERNKPVDSIIREMLWEMGFTDTFNLNERTRDDDIHHIARHYYEAVVGAYIYGSKEAYEADLKKEEFIGMDGELLTEAHTRQQLLTEFPGGHQGKEIVRRLDALAQKEINQLKGQSGDLPLC